MSLLKLQGDRIIHAIERESSLWKLLVEFLAAYKGRTEAWAGTSDNSEVLTAINNLSRKVDQMSSNIDRIEKEAADLTDDVAQVRTAIDGLSATISDLKTTVADLQAQVSQGQLDQARLDAAAAKLEKADDDLDAITLPSTEPPAEG